MLGNHEPTVDRVCDGLAQLRVVLEDAPRRVHREIPVADLRLDEELALVDAVLVGEPFAWAGGNAQTSASPRSHISRCGRVGPDDPAELIDAAAKPSDLNGSWLFFQFGLRTARAGVLLVPLLEVVRTGRHDRRLDALSGEGLPAPPRNCIDIRAMKSGAAFLSVTVKTCPAAL